MFFLSHSSISNERAIYQNCIVSYVNHGDRIIERLFSINILERSSNESNQKLSIQIVETIAPSKKCCISTTINESSSHSFWLIRFTKTNEILFIIGIVFNDKQRTIEIRFDCRCVSIQCDTIM